MEAIPGMSATKRRFFSAMNLGGLTFKEALSRTWTKLNEHELMTRAAAIAFYAIAALVPFMTLVILLAARLLPWITGADHVDPSETLGQILPPEAAKVVVGELEDIQERGGAGLVSFGTIALLWLNSSLFIAVMDAMNRIRGVEETRPYWKQRLLAVAMSVLEAIVIILALASTLLLPQILEFFQLGVAASFFATLTHGLTVFVIFLISFSCALYFGPNADQRWEWITPGSLLGTLLLLGVSYLFRFYVQTWGDYNATYGSLAGVVVLLSWLWLCGLVLLAAAELNAVIERASPLGGDPG